MALELATTYLLAKGIVAPRHQAELLLSYILNCAKHELYLPDVAMLSTAETSEFVTKIEQCAKKIPVAYLCGEVAFYDVDCKIGRGCLIPRPETELLVDKVIKTIQKRQSGQRQQRIAEFGVGSGAIPLAVLGKTQAICWIATDISAEALYYAQINLNNPKHINNGNCVHLIKSDGLSALGHNFDIIVSNPPYIASAELQNLAVSLHEPQLALDGGEDGLAAMRQLFNSAYQCLSPKGELLVEFSPEQLERLYQLGIATGLEVLACYHDLNQRPRVLHLQKP